MSLPPVSAEGAIFIAQHEAIVLSTYKDGGGVLTIGAGHTAAAGAPIPVPGMTLSQGEAIALKVKDLAKFHDWLADMVEVQLNQAQTDALLSWIYNVGPSAARNSTLMGKLNAGDMQGAADQLPRWNRDNGKVVKGLKVRRAAERNLFLTGDYALDAVPVYDKFPGTAQPIDAQELIAQVKPLLEDEGEEFDAPIETRLANPSSRLLPKFRPQQTPAHTRKVLDHALVEMAHSDLRDPVIIMGVRGYYSNSMGGPGNDRGLYDDAIFVITKEAVWAFNANTDPSRHRKGIATLKAPQIVKYRQGPHGFRRKGGPIEALRQASGVTVLRDGQGEDRDGPPRFWINIHDGGVTTTSSAGCQTLPPHQWAEFKQLVYSEMNKAGQTIVPYVLIEYQNGKPPVAPPAKAPEQATEKPKSAIRDALIVIGTAIIALCLAWAFQSTGDTADGPDVSTPSEITQPANSQQ